MPKFKFVDFSCNLLQVDNFIENKEASLIIYPTQNNANLAQAHGQYSWKFEDISYLAIEDFKEMLLGSDKMFWEDDKRVIALYRLLTDEDKIFFKVNDFFDFIKLANKIFKLFEELAEELIDFSSVFQRLEEENSTLFPWQIEYYERIHQLILKYQGWIEENNSNDRIFNINVKNIDISYFSNYASVFVVNQFYYSNIEREILRQMEEAGIEVTLVYQLPEEFVDKETFNAQPFNYSDLELFATQKPKLNLIIDRNKFTMMNSLCRIITEDNISQIIDRDFYETPYAKLLSRNTFDIKYAKAIVNTGLYQFLEITQQLIQAMEYFNNRYYLPIHVLIRAFLNQDFTRYFQIEHSSNLLEEVYNIREKGVLYCDSNAEIGKESISEALKIAIKRILTFINNIKRIKSVEGLIALFDSEEGIVLDRICSLDELQYSNIKELVYTELANLKSFTYNNLINKWSDLSDKAEHIIIFKLFCDGLKAKKLKYIELDASKRVRISSLLNTRNNNFDSLIFLNMVEGVLPTSRTSQFLFNEKQREILTLKSYEEIRLREKYYFQRLVLSAERCYFLGRENIDEDTSLSSFLEELPLVKPSRKMIEDDRGYGEIFNNFSTSSLPKVADDFWSVKLKAEELAPKDNLLKLSYTKLKSLIDNPLYFAIHDWARVSERSIFTEATLDYRFVGIFAQDFVNHVIARIKDNFLNQEVFYKFQYMSVERLSEIYDSLLRQYKDKDYYIPHNYTYTFVNIILKDALVEGMRYFFNTVMHYKLDLTEKKLKLIPEEGFSLGKKQKYKSFISESENDYNLGIAVTGDADLRVENQEDASKIVIDFKTGSLSPQILSSYQKQLTLYEYIYYWDDIEASNKVKAGIFHILKQIWEPQKKGAEVTIENLKNKIIEVLNEIVISGFSLPTNLENAKKYGKITRSDLVIGR